MEIISTAAHLHVLAALHHCENGGNHKITVEAVAYCTFMFFAQYMATALTPRAAMSITMCCAWFLAVMSARLPPTHSACGGSTVYVVLARCLLVCWCGVLVQRAHWLRGGWCVPAVEGAAAQPKGNIPVEHGRAPSATLDMPHILLHTSMQPSAAWRHAGMIASTALAAGVLRWGVPCDGPDAIRTPSTASFIAKSTRLGCRAPPRSFMLLRSPLPLPTRPVGL